MYYQGGLFLLESGEAGGSELMSTSWGMLSASWGGHPERTTYSWVPRSH